MGRIKGDGESGLLQEGHLGRTSHQGWTAAGETLPEGNQQRNSFLWDLVLEAQDKEIGQDFHAFLETFRLLCVYECENSKWTSESHGNISSSLSIFCMSLYCSQFRVTFSSDLPIPLHFPLSPFSSPLPHRRGLIWGRKSHVVPVILLKLLEWLSCHLPIVFQLAFIFVLLWHKVSLYSPDWPVICDPPASAFPVLGSQICTHHHARPQLLFSNRFWVEVRFGWLKNQSRTRFQVGTSTILLDSIRSWLALHWGAISHMEQTKQIQLSGKFWWVWAL